MSENQEHKTWIMYKKAPAKVIDYVGNPWGSNAWKIVEQYVSGNDSYCNMECVTPQGTWRANVVASSFSKAKKDATILFDNNTSTKFYADSAGNAYATVTIIPPEKQYIKLSSIHIIGDYANGACYVDVFTYDKDTEVKLSSSYHGKGSTTDKRLSYNRSLSYDKDIYSSKIQIRAYITNGGWGNLNINEIQITNCSIKY